MISIILHGAYLKMHITLALNHTIYKTLKYLDLTIQYTNYALAYSSYTAIIKLLYQY